MTLHLPWLEMTILLPLLGAMSVAIVRSSEQAQQRSATFFILTLLCAVGAWLDFNSLHTFEAHDRWYFVSKYLGPEAIVVDELSAPLLPLVALQYLLTAYVTVKTKIRRFSFFWTLVAESVLLATLSCRSSWGLVGLLSLGTIPPLLEILSRGKPWKVYALHMGLFVVLLGSGQALMPANPETTRASIAAVSLLTFAVLLRSGIVPVHCWMTDLFEHATFGTALLTVTPMVGAYAAVRLVLPVAPPEVLRGIALISLITAAYGAAMSLVQHEARRFFCYLFLSHSSLVLVGLETAAPVGLTGALTVWVSIGMAMTGFGLTLRAIEARVGRLSLDKYHGLYANTPTLAVLFILTGLASIGFPGTFGFVGTELLIDGVVHVFPLTGIAVVIAAALNGIAVLLAFFRIFTGTQHLTSVNLSIRLRERLAVLCLSALILGGGLWPQPGITTRYHAAMRLIESRQLLFPETGHEHSGSQAHRVHITSTEDSAAEILVP